MKSIGELYFDSVFFQDEESKTIGQPLIGSNIETLVKNRRGAKGRLTPKGREILDRIVSQISEILDMRVKAVWDKHCGCSMCPCSPGYRLKAELCFRSTENTRFSISVGKDGSFTFFQPKYTYELGYKDIETLTKNFS